MRRILLVFILVLQGCSTTKKMSCIDKVEQSYEAEKKDSNIYVFRGAIGRNREDAIWLLQRGMPVYHRAGQPISIKRSRKVGSSGEYNESNYSGIWTLRDGLKSKGVIVCEGKDYDTAYGVVKRDEILRFLNVRVQRGE